MYQEGLFVSEMEKKALNRIPYNCHLDLTFQCNLNCIHCCIVKEDRQELETHEIKDILNQLAAVGVLNLHLSGGEILSRNDFFEIAEYARKLHFALTLSTNGTLINHHNMNRIANLNPLKVNITIFSTSSEVHDNITNVPGSLVKSIKAVEMLRERDIEVDIAYIMMKQNMEDYEQVKKLSENLGAKFKPDHRILPKPNGDISPIKYQIDRNDLYDILIGVNKEIEKNDNDERNINKNNQYDDTICNAALSASYISPYGDIYPCSMLPIFCGNLKNNSFEYIWNNSEEMLEISRLRKSKLPICSKCDHLNYCHFCPGVAYLEENSVMTPYSRACEEAEIISEIKKIGGI